MAPSRAIAFSILSQFFSGHCAALATSRTCLQFLPLAKNSSTRLLGVPALDAALRFPPATSFASTFAASMKTTCAPRRPRSLPPPLSLICDSLHNVRANGRSYESSIQILHATATAPRIRSPKSRSTTCRSSSTRLGWCSRKRGSQSIASCIPCCTRRLHR
jgi:hypothetical protein